MKQIFVKTIQGREVEFSRLLYPLRYKIFIRNSNANPTVITLIKDTKEGWIIVNPDQSPEWFNNMNFDIQHAINENEAEAVSSKR